MAQTRSRQDERHPLESACYPRYTGGFRGPRAVNQGDTDQRRRVHFQGRVQGVGFRYTVRGVASRFDVAGYVKNVPDGRVLLVAEGPAEELDRFLRAVHVAMDRYIGRCDETVGPATGEFTQFEIRY